MPAAIKAPPFFVQAFFRDSQDDEGWSEGYWLNAASYDAALTAMDQLLVSRVSLLTQEFFVDYVRVSSADIRGDTVIEYPGVGNNRGTYKARGGNQVGFSLPSEVAALVRFEGVVTLVGPPPRTIPVHFIKPFHGIPIADLLVNTDDQLDLTGFWKGAFDAFVTRMLARGTLFGVTKPPTVGVATPWSVTAIEVRSRLMRRKVGRPFGLSKGRLVAR